MDSGEGGPKVLNCIRVFFTIAAVFLVRKVIRCLWMFQKTKGKKADSMLKYPLGDP